MPTTWWGRTSTRRIGRLRISRKGSAKGAGLHPIPSFLLSLALRNPSNGTCISPRGGKMSGPPFHLAIFFLSRNNCVQGAGHIYGTISIKKTTSYYYYGEG